jgi:hypothetical protein
MKVEHEFVVAEKPSYPIRLNPDQSYLVVETTVSQDEYDETHGTITFTHYVVEAPRARFVPRVPADDSAIMDDIMGPAGPG